MDDPVLHSLTRKDEQEVGRTRAYGYMKCRGCSQPVLAGTVAVWTVEWNAGYIWHPKCWDDRPAESQETSS